MLDKSRPHPKFYSCVSWMQFSRVELLDPVQGLLIFIDSEKISLDEISACEMTYFNGLLFT